MDLKPEKYMQEALKVCRRMKLDMPVVQALPEESRDVEESNRNVCMALEYQTCFSDYREYEDAIASQLGFRNRKNIIIPIIEDDINENVLATTFYREDGSCFIVLNKILRRYPYLQRKRVFFHELAHIYASDLVNHCRDLDIDTSVKVLESVPEYGMRRAFEIKSKHRNDEAGQLACLIKANTPYRTSVELGENADKYYVSADGCSGYRAFIQDIRRYKSGRYAMNRLRECMKTAGKGRVWI